MEGVCNVLTWLCTYYVSWSSSPKLNTCGHIFFLDLFSKKSAIHLIVEDMLSDTKVFGDFINLSACMCCEQVRGDLIEGMYYKGICYYI
jgi:hypothetical protein